MPCLYVTQTTTDISAAFDFEEESGGISAYRLKSNGLRVLVLSEAAAPVVTFMVTYHVGSRNESTGLTGATHFLEHLMFKGSERFNKKLGTSVFNLLQRVGAQVNATTWYDRTNYYEQLPREHLPMAIEIEADRMRHALIDAEEVERERTVILNEFDRGENEPVRNLYHSVWSTAYQAHPYHHPTIGWRSDIAGVTAAGLRHFYDTYYWPNNATVAIIGDVEPDAALALVERYFGGIPSSPEPIPAAVTVEPVQKGERRLKIRKAGQLGAVMVAFKSPPGLSEEADALDLLSTILTVGKTSRLHRKLTDAGLTTHLFGGVSRLRDPGLFYVYAFLAPGIAHDAVEEVIVEEIARVAADGIPDTELNRARNQLRAQVAFSRDGSYSIASQLNEAVACGDWKLYTSYMDRIDRVTSDDIRHAANAWLVEDLRTIGWYDPVVNGEDND
jgi:zinc protease